MNYAAIKIGKQYAYRRASGEMLRIVIESKSQVIDRRNPKGTRSVTGLIVPEGSGGDASRHDAERFWEKTGDIDADRITPWEEHAELRAQSKARKEGREAFEKAALAAHEALVKRLRDAGFEVRERSSMYHVDSNVSVAVPDFPKRGDFY